MADFYFRKLTVTGADKKLSEVEFKEGLNIVFGPSNTGKSYIIECIDYLFGADGIRFDATTGYDTFELLIDSDKGCVTIQRKQGSNVIFVSSERPDIESGEYASKWRKDSNKMDISSVWLRLIGIIENHEIIKNSRRDKIRLTLRLFSHIFLIKETAVLKEGSIIAPIQNTVESATFSSLYFLLTGEDFADSTPKEEKKIREAKKRQLSPI